MKESERLKRNRQIVMLYEEGTMPTEIGRRVGLRADMVRKILKNRGYVFDYKPPMQDADSIWDQSEEKRRLAIWERARQGARAALLNAA